MVFSGIIVMILESQEVFRTFDNIFMTLVELPGFGLNCISHDIVQLMLERSHNY